MDLNFLDAGGVGVLKGGSGYETRVSCAVYYKLTNIYLRLWDTVWDVFHAPNAINPSAHLHQTTATKDGAHREREAPRAYTVGGQTF